MSEVWKDVLGYVGYYEVSNTGKVRSKTRKIPNGKGRIGFRTFNGKMLQPGKDSYGYLTVSLHKKGKGNTYRIHQLVWISFNGKVKNSMVIDHIDNNPENNNVSNLQLLSHRNNVAKGIIPKSNKLSKYPNVSFRKDRNKWFGRIQHNGKSVITGTFDNELDAFNSVVEYKTKNNIE